ncbi:MAG: hypothetical protein Q7V16_00290 [Hydrogenophaga sp.]|nr:hypothetical protein [Hydrogenophaga sp.]
MDNDDPLTAYPPLLAHILQCKEFGPLLRSRNRPKHQAAWRELIVSLARTPPSSARLLERFHTQWHVCHHFLRELVDDDDLLIPMLRVWLPRYDGPELILYRGENIDRFEAGRIGTAWSDKQETASMFAQGLNAVGKGGVILRTLAPVTAIIAGPSKHSAQWLGESEFTLDPGKLGDITATARFRPSH